MHKFVVTLRLKNISLALETVNIFGCTVAAPSRYRLIYRRAHLCYFCAVFNTAATRDLLILRAR